MSVTIRALTLAAAGPVVRQRDVPPATNDCRGGVGAQRAARRLSLVSDPLCAAYIKGGSQSLVGVTAAVLPCRILFGPFCIPASLSASALVVPIYRLVNMMYAER